MAFVSWLKSLFGRKKPDDGLVPFYDFEAKRVVRIPAAELREGCVQVKIQGMNEVVWVAAEQLQMGPIRHPPFDAEARELIRRIQTAFAEHRDLSLEEWEDGFRRDANVEREIALWMYAGDVYRKFAADESSAERRRDIYRVLVACMTSRPDSVWNVLKPTALSRPEAERIVNRFYGGSNTDDPA